MEATIKLGKVVICVQLSPRLVDFHKPPETEPAYKPFTLDPVLNGSMARVRPPMLSGPSSCHDNPAAFSAV